MDFTRTLEKGGKKFAVWICEYGNKGQDGYSYTLYRKLLRNVIIQHIA